METTERDGARKALEQAVEAARTAEGRGDLEVAAACYESAAQIAMQLGDGLACPGEEDPSLVDAQGCVEGPEPVPAERVVAGGLPRSAAPLALVWKGVERDLRVFFFRNLPAVVDSIREDFERAKDLGERQAMVEGFREIGNVLVLLAQMRNPKRIL